MTHGPRRRDCARIQMLLVRVAACERFAARPGPDWQAIGAAFQRRIARSVASPAGRGQIPSASTFTFVRRLADVTLGIRRVQPRISEWVRRWHLAIIPGYQRLTKSEGKFLSLTRGHLVRHDYKYDDAK